MFLFLYLFTSRSERVARRDKDAGSATPIHAPPTQTGVARMSQAKTVPWWFLCYVSVCLRWMRVSPDCPRRERTSVWGSCTLITLSGATETDNKTCSAAPRLTLTISAHAVVQRARKCPQARDGARLLIMKLQITKSNYSPISSQKILWPELPSPPSLSRLLFPVAFSLSSIPRFFFFFFFLHFSLSLSLSPHHVLPPLPGAAADRMTSPPSLGGLQHLKTQCIRTVCVCVCLRSTSRSRRSSATDDSKDHHFQKRSIVCVCVSVCDDAEWNQIVCVCVCERRRIRNHEAWMGRSTLTVSKPRLWAHLKDLVLMPRCCVSTEGLKMAVITSPHSISLHLNWIWAQTVPPSVSLHWLYARCCRITYRYCNAALQSRKPLQHQLLMWKTTCCLLAFSWEHLPVTSSRSWAPTLLFNMWPLKWSYITLNA